MAKKRKTLDIYESDILGNLDCQLDSDFAQPVCPPQTPESLLHVDLDFLSGIVEEAEARVKEQEEAVERGELLSPTSSPMDIMDMMDPDDLPDALPLDPPMPPPPRVPPAPPVKAKINGNGAKSNQQGLININIKPGSPLTNAIANPTDNDNLLAVIRDNKPSNTMLKAIMEEIAEEAAYIKAWRNDHWSTEDTSEATFKRIKMLKHLVETIVEQEKLKKESVSGKVDFHGEAFQRVLKYFLETIQKTFRKVHIPEQFEDIFFTELAKAFDSFEKSAERLYYGKE